MLVSFIAQHSLPFTLIPHIINLSQELSKDYKVLSSLSMAACTASYKLNYGLAPYISSSVIEELQNSSFSINVDECMSNAHQKVFSILVPYYSEKQKLSIVQHYKSKAFNVVNAKTLFDYVKDVLAKDEIPLANLISNLCDSTNYMRGKKAGFETLLRNHAVHMLDIDGDTCHHMHNIVKKFLSPFEKYIEYLCSDIHNDMNGVLICADI